MKKRIQLFQHLEVPTLFDVCMEIDLVLFWLPYGYKVDMQEWEAREYIGELLSKHHLSSLDIYENIYE